MSKRDTAHIAVSELSEAQAKAELARLAAEIAAPDRRGGHRERQDARGRAATATRQGRAGNLRSARRSLYDEIRVPEAQPAPGRGRPPGVCQSAQLRGGLAAPARSGGHRVAAARLLRLRLGRDERDAGR